MDKTVWRMRCSRVYQCVDDIFMVSEEVKHYIQRELREGSGGYIQFADVNKMQAAINPNQMVVITFEESNWRPQE